jgi:hypothetical protein
VGAGERQKPIRPGLGGAQAGDEVGDLDAHLVADPTFPLDASDLGGARPGAGRLRR